MSQPLREALSSMKKPRLLRINGLDGWLDDWLDDCDGSNDGNWDEPVDCDGPEFSYNLQYLEWREFPYTKLPSSFKPRNLVQLKLRASTLKRLWNNGVKVNFLCQFIEHCL